MNAKCIVLVQILIVSLTVLTSTLADDVGNKPAVPQRKRRSTVSDAMTKIEDIVDSMKSSAEDALESVESFTAEVEAMVANATAEAENAIKKVFNETLQFGEEVTSAVATCIESYEDDAYTYMNDTIYDTISCLEERVENIFTLISNLSTLAVNAVEEAENGLTDMKNCTAEYSSNLIKEGTCLAAISLKLDVKAAEFVVESGILVSSIAYSISTLRTDLATCIAEGVAEAELYAAKLALQIGVCSAKSIYSVVTN